MTGGNIFRQAGHCEPERTESVQCGTTEIASRRNSIYCTCHGATPYRVPRDKDTLRDIDDSSAVITTTQQMTV